MYKRITVLSVILVVMLCSSFAFCEDSGEVKKYRRRQMKSDGADRIEARINELSTQLNLTPEQKEKVKDIYARAKEETKNVLEEARIKVRKIRVKVDEEVRAILSEEQKKKFHRQAQMKCDKAKNQKPEAKETK